MAGMKTWVPGEEVVAADLQSYVQTQVVPVFTSAAQRSAQWPSPPRGAHSFLYDVGIMQQYSGSAWGAVAMPDIYLTGGNIYAATQLTMQANITEFRADVTGNAYTNKPVQIHKLTGAGMAGLALVDDSVAMAAQLHLLYSGVLALHLVSWDASIHLPMVASAFTVAAMAREVRTAQPYTGPGVDLVDQFRVVTYDVTTEPFPRDDGSDPPPAPPPVPRIGLLADDLLNVAAELVDVDDDGPAGYDLAGVVALLTKAVQELAARVAQLEGGAS